MKIRVSNNGLCLFNLFIIIIIKYIPTHEPTMQNVPNQIEYGTFNIPLNRNDTVEAPEAKIIMYIPDAVATEGGTPRLINKGLNIIPPPSPKAPDIHPPRRENNTSLTKFSLVNSISFSFPCPYFDFKFYSFYIYLNE